jgi:hypothetical protein
MTEPLFKTNYMRYLGEVGSINTVLASAWLAARPLFDKNLDRMLGEFSLEKHLQGIKASGAKAHILVFGCDEGLPSTYIAQRLVRLDLLDAVELVTLDSDLTRLEIAQEYCGLLNPPLPQLLFLHHDLARPLTECEGLRKLGIWEFDMIFSFATQHLPQARIRVEDLYRALKPGGVIQLAGWFLKEEGSEAWLSPHPALTPIMQAWLNSIAAINPGVEVSMEQASWLQESGAENIVLDSHPNPIGGESTQGPALMRMLIAVMVHFGPEFVARGLLDKAEYESATARVYQQVTSQAVGYVKTVVTLARKPSQ